MSEQEQINKMAEDICRQKHNCNDACNPTNSCMALKYAHRAYMAGYRKQAWISVEDRLPEKDGRYLFLDLGMHRGVSFEEIRITHFKHGDRYHDYMWRNHYSHWMPLPEPPKGE